MPIPFMIVTATVFYAVSFAAAQEAPAGPESDPPAVQQRSGSKTQVVLLGTGNPVPDPRRSGPGVAVVVNATPYLVDMGPGIVRQAAAAENRGVWALDARRLRYVFVTHLHSDHTLGFADLIFTPWVVGRTRPLEVYGPPGIKAMADNILQAYKEDIAMRSHGLEMAAVEGSLVNVHEILPGTVFEDHNVKVEAIAVDHGSWKYAYAYRFETEDRVVVISGDTGPSENLIARAKNCDVLVHEVYSAAALSKGPPSMQRYHSSFHTSGIELGIIAAEIQPKLLVLYHQLSFSPKDEVIEEIRRSYQGPLAYGEDLDIH